MPYFPDLSYYSNSRNQDASVALNVGWLSKEHSYTQGRVPEDFINRLWLYCGKFINPMRGYSPCELCQDNAQWPITVSLNEKVVNLGSAEIRVISEDNTIYASPNMIIHYILVHGYYPPEEFINAVLMGPLPDSPEFLALEAKFKWRTI
jgi:hypothetical protein